MGRGKKHWMLSINGGFSEPHCTDLTGDTEAKYVFITGGKNRNLGVNLSTVCVSGWQQSVSVAGNSLCQWLATVCVSGWQQSVSVAGNSLCQWLATVCVSGWQQSVSVAGL